MEHRVEVAQPLRQVLSLYQTEWVIEGENLHHAPRPTNTLPDMRRQAFRRQPRRLRNAHIR